MDPKGVAVSLGIVIGGVCGVGGLIIGSGGIGGQILVREIIRISAILQIQFLCLLLNVDMEGVEGAREDGVLGLLMFRNAVGVKDDADGNR